MCRRFSANYVRVVTLQENVELNVDRILIPVPYSESRNCWEDAEVNNGL
jgi:hypothetical protein